MKLINYIVAAIAAVTFAASAQAAAWDLRMVQYDASNRSREVVISPAANSLLGFGADKRVVNITAGANIVISGNQISASASGNVIKGATFADGQLLYISNGTTGEVTGIAGATFTPGNNTISFNGTISSTGFAPTAITWGSSIVPSANGGAGAVNGIMKANGSGAVSQAVSGADYEPARTTVSQADAEAGASTTVYAWTPERVAQAIAALAAGGSAVPAGIGDLWPTADIASPPSGYFAAGDYGTQPNTALGAWSIIVKSAGTVADPTVDIAPGAVPAGTVVTMSTATASPFFTATNNGTDPTYTVGTVGNTFTVSAAGTWGYRANKQGWVSSAVQSATYTIDQVPELTSAEIDGTALTLTYSEAVSRGGSYSNAHFDLDMSTTGSNIAVSYVGGDGTTTHTYSAASAAVNGETVDLDFSGAANSIEETGGYNQDLAAITSAAVTNSTAGGGGGSWTYVVPYADATTDAFIAPDSIWWHEVTIGSGTATKFGARISNFQFASALIVGLYTSAKSKVADVTIAVSANGDVEGTISGSVSAGTYILAGIGKAGDNNAFSVPYKGTSAPTLYYKAGVTPGVLPSTLPTEDGTVSNRGHAFGVFVTP